MKLRVLPVLQAPILPLHSLFFVLLTLRVHAPSQAQTTFAIPLGMHCGADANATQAPIRVLVETMFTVRAVSIFRVGEVVPPTPEGGNLKGGPEALRLVGAAQANQTDESRSQRAI